MVKLTRIYTRSGDKGETTLGSGQRILKCDQRIEAIGAVDESNTVIGLCRLQTDGIIDADLCRIQNDLFDVGADLCMPDLETPALRIVKAQVKWIEERIDYYNASLDPLTSFVLPGGSKLAAQLHVARTVVRRAECKLVCLNQQANLNQELIKYINRLSDLFFVMARYANNFGKSDVLWVPGANRP